MLFVKVVQLTDLFLALFLTLFVFFKRSFEARFGYLKLVGIFLPSELVEFFKSGHVIVNFVNKKDHEPLVLI